MNLFVANLSTETSEESLRKLFSEYGNIVSLKIPIDRTTGFSRGFGFVEMDNEESAEDAMLNIDMSYLEGNIITVKEAKPQGAEAAPKHGGGQQRSGGGGNYRSNNNNKGGGNYRSNNSGNSGGSGYDPNRQAGRYNNSKED